MKFVSLCNWQRSMIRILHEACLMYAVYFAVTQEVIDDQAGHTHVACE
jgi:hypothetical protein